MHKYFIASATAITFLTASAVLCNAAAIPESQKNWQVVRTFENPNYTPTEPFSTTRNFGFSLSLFDQSLLVGGFGVGAVHLVDPSTGDELLRLIDPEPNVPGYGFGITTKQAGGLIAVSNPLRAPKQTNTGTVYLFDPSTGMPVDTLLSPEPEMFGYFGQQLGFADGVLYVSQGADIGTITGRVYAFDSIDGSLLSTIQNPKEGMGFGTQIVEHNGGVFISSRESGPTDFGAGWVHKFEAGSTSPSLSIAAPFPERTLWFGQAVDAKEEFLLVGAPRSPVGEISRVGEAYLYDANTGELLYAISNPDPDQYDEFGSSVAILDDYFVIGASWDDDGGRPANIGSAYIYELATGDLVARVRAPNPGQNDFFADASGGNGGILAFGNNFFAASTYVGSQDFPTGDVGEVYLFAIPEPAAGALAILACLAFLRRFRSRERSSRCGAYHQSSVGRD